MFGLECLEAVLVLPELLFEGLGLLSPLVLHLLSLCCHLLLMSVLNRLNLTLGFLLSGTHLLIEVVRLPLQLSTSLVL